MSLAFSVKIITIGRVVGLVDHRVKVGSVWKTGNLLFRAQQSGANSLHSLEQWAKANSTEGREFIVWKDNLRLVVQPVSSRYCYDLLPVLDP